MIFLTPKQHLALDTSRHLAIIANAGSGKTHVMVERFISILLGEHARVSEVVAITFTEKAAAELRRKIAQAVVEKLEQADDAETKKKLRALRSELSGAVIDTIHSFCARLLRDYPVEADVDAAFTILEEIDRNAMTETAVRETIARILRLPDNDRQRQTLFDVLRALGRKRTLDIVHEMLRKRELVDRWLAPGGLYTRSDDEILLAWRAALSKTANSILGDEQLNRDLEQLVAAAVRPGDDGRKVFESRKGDDEVLSRAEALIRLSEHFLTKKGEPKKRIFPDPLSSLRQAAKRVARNVEVLKKLLPGLRDEHPREHCRMLQQVRFFIELYREVVQRYTEAKGDGAYLDFDDLQIKTRHLLGNERVRQKLAQRFTFIMVDEYQDTNLLQYEILLPLLADLRRGNLCIVGDPKQSIYGFRDADVSVFHRTAHDIKLQSGTEGIVTLDASFRLLRDVAAFVNLLFSSIMREREDEFEVAYEPLVCARANDAPGRVELLLPPAPHNENDEDEMDERSEIDDPAISAAGEEEMVARRIVQLVQSGYQVFDRDEHPHPVRFRDIAILLRSRTGLGKLESALLQAGVPYLVSGGVGYFQTQAIYDFYHYFCFLLDTYDDVALVGILRSPFFHVSDAELLEWRLAHRTGGWWESIQSRSVDDVRFPGIARAQKRLSGDLDLAYRLTVPELIEHIIEATGYAGFLAGTPRGEQMKANVEKLKRVARQYADRGFTDLYDFTRRLQRLIEEYQEEGQATVDVDADAVRIMTIHAAKGLEFPVVVIPSLDRAFRDDVPCYLDQQLGLGFEPSDDSQTPIVALMQQRTRRRTDAEEKRVFYVACTRARDLLILTASKRTGTNSRSCWAWVQNVLQLEEETEAVQKDFNVATEFLVQRDGGYESVTIRHTLPVYLIHSHQLEARRTAYDAPGSELPLPSDVYIKPIGGVSGGEVFSATKVRTYLQCPSKYYLRYVIGLPAPSVRLFHDDTDDDQDTEIPKDLKGRAFHHVMQHCERFGPDREAILAELKKYIARDSYSILSEPSIELERLANTIVAVVQSEFWREVLRGKDHRVEFTIMTRVGEDVLLGTLDRVYRDQHGVWTVLDFKTDAVTAETLPDKRTEYEAQLKFYSLLVRKHFRADSVQACLLFSELVEQPVRTTLSAAELENFEGVVRSVIERIRRGEFSHGDVPCAGCPFLPAGCWF